MGSTLTGSRSNEVVLSVAGVGKQYHAFAKPLDRLAYLLGFDAGRKSRWALHELSFTLQRGQVLGIVGDNGAGKSTLLKLLSGVLQPTTGRICSTGRVTAILELGVGFHPEFTGRQNLHFGGSLIGISDEQMHALYDEILAFAELGEAIDRPVKTYSSGMVVRLAFALVTAMEPDVLIIDEALAVGDQHFQKKCVQRIEAFRKRGCTVLFCSHSLYHVRQLCDQVLWLDHGQMRGLGDTESVLAAYETHARLQDVSPGGIDPSGPGSGAVVSPGQTEQDWVAAGRRAGLHDARLIGVDTAVRTELGLILSGPDLIIQVQAVSVTDELPSIGVMLEQVHGVGITSVATHAEGVRLTPRGCQDGWTTWQVTLTFPDLPLHSGQYCLSFYLFEAQGLVVYDEWKDFIEFQWLSPSLTPGLVRLPHHWS